MLIFILAGGFGVRLKSRTSDMPKLLAPIENVFSTSENVSVFREEEPLGTGGAIKNALKFASHSDDFLVFNGDTYMKWICINSFLYPKKLLILTEVIRKFATGMAPYSSIRKAADVRNGFINTGCFFARKSNQGNPDVETE